MRNAAKSREMHPPMMRGWVAQVGGNEPPSRKVGMGILLGGLGQFISNKFANRAD